MKKLVIIAYDINPYLGSESGNTYTLVKILSAGFDLVVYTQEKHRSDLLDKHFHMIYVKSDIFSDFFEKLKLYNFRYTMFLRKIKHDLVRIDDENTFIHFMTPHGIHSYNPYAGMLKVPYIIGPIGGFLTLPEGFREYNGLVPKIKEFYYRNIIKNKKWRQYFVNSCAIIAGTPLVVNHLPDICKNRVTIILESVLDTDFFNGPESRTSDDRIRIIYIGRLELYKGCTILLSSFERLVQKGYHNIELLIAGWGSQESKMRKRIRSGNLENHVKLLGRIPRDNVRDLLNQADIFCLPTLKEPGGTSILEAMSCCLPVITTNYGGPSFTVNKDCGILIEPTDVDTYVNDLTEKLEYLINHKNIRNQLGMNGRRHVIENYSSQALERKIFSFYSKNLKGM